MAHNTAENSKKMSQTEPDKTATMRDRLGHIFHLTAGFIQLVLLMAFFAMGTINRPCAQERDIPVNTDWDHERHSWEASWITHPTASVNDYGVFGFRNTFVLDEVPESQPVYVSADNRYRLFINGRQVADGPARGSLSYWRYETVDIAPYLQKGMNLIAAEVFNLGVHRPVAQFSYQTAFILQAEGKLGTLVNTGISNNWKVFRNNAFRPIPVTREMVRKFYVAGPCDSIIAREYPRDWEKSGFDDHDWPKSLKVTLGAGRGYMHGMPWLLVPRNIPMMEEAREDIRNLIRRDGMEVSVPLLEHKKPLVIPPRSRQVLLLDQARLTVGYPLLTTGKGAGSFIRVTYSEALYHPDGSKGNRNDTQGKHIEGYYDVFVPDGREITFRPLWIRTFRFIQLEIITSDEPLFITDYYNIFTAYPFEQHAGFECDNPLLDDIWKTGWHTARLCAGETYMDCPYWEQLQYIGDTRIQALISLYNSGDDRLMRNALQLADQSRIPDGLTLGRAPSGIPQVTPPFSLYWIAMVHDYYMHREDDDFIWQFLPGIRGVLTWFENRMDTNNLLGSLDWFNFTDWTRGFQVGVPAGADTGNSALISLNYAYALARASELFEHYGYVETAKKYVDQAGKITRAAFQLCWDPDRGLMADTPEKTVFSQHTNIQAILTGAIVPEQMQPLMEKILSDTSLIQTTVYYKFYLFQALQKSGMGDRYIPLLKPWKEMLDKGLTTFEEGDYDERSDCHAWGSSPCYHFLSLICGITPCEPGFASVRIAPNLGSLSRIKGYMPHPQGTILLEVRRKGNNGIEGSVTLPGNLKGTFIWNEQIIELIPGKQNIRL
jgi:hypothetical protein